jgi:hypothetical protein
MGFVPCSRSLKIQESRRTPTPKMGAHLEVWGFILSHSPTLPEVIDVSPGFPSCSALLQALALVASPRLGLWHYIYQMVKFVIWLFEGPQLCNFDFWKLWYIYVYQIWFIHCLKIWDLYIKVIWKVKKTQHYNHTHVIF